MFYLLFHSRSIVQYAYGDLKLLNHGSLTASRLFNPFVPLAARKGGLAIRVNSFIGIHLSKNCWWSNFRNVLTNTSPRNILWKHTLFLSYFHKYQRSKRHSSRRVLGMIRLIKIDAHGSSERLLSLFPWPMLVKAT